MRYISILISVFIAVIMAVPAYCAWEEMIRVNTETTGKQAPRDSDCPWPIAADDSGNVYTVWEDWRDTENDELHIYFRKKNRDGTWEQSDEKISNEPDSLGKRFGHRLFAHCLGITHPCYLPVM